MTVVTIFFFNLNIIQTEVAPRCNSLKLQLHGHCDTFQIHGHCDTFQLEGCWSTLREITSFRSMKANHAYAACTSYGFITSSLWDCQRKSGRFTTLPSVSSPSSENDYRMLYDSILWQTALQPPANDACILHIECDQRLEVRFWRQSRLSSVVRRLSYASD
jgi:hypothetical protein